MLLHAALSDPGPYGERTRAVVAKLQKYLAQPRNRGRVIAIPRVMKAIAATEDEMKHLKVFLAQTWLTINQDAPLDAKAHYKDMLDTELGKLDPDVRVVISRTIENYPRQAYVSKDRAQTITNTVTAPMSQEFVKTYERREAKQLVKATSLEEAIARVRDAYITAPIGDLPNIPDLMAGVTDRPEGFTETAVRERQLAEDWRGQRGQHVVRAFDIIPEEVKLVAITRAVEAHRILFSHLKAISHIYTEYYKTGKMPATDSKGKSQLKLRADPSILASLAETMRRMLEGSGEKISITLNNTTAAKQAVQAEGAKADVQISQETKNYLAKMATMSDVEIQREMDNMDQLRLLLANGGVTGETASAQSDVVDVISTPISVDKGPDV